MKLKKQFFKKLIFAILFFIIAIFCTILLKSTLMAQNPEYALPIITVKCNGEGLPSENQTLDSYSWQFLTTVKTSSPINENSWNDLPAAWEPPNSPLTVRFSYLPTAYTISRSGPNNNNFTEVGGELYTPSIPGTYTYKIEASWGKNKNMTYYFKIRIPEQN